MPGRTAARGRQTIAKGIPALFLMLTDYIGSLKTLAEPVTRHPAILIHQPFPLLAADRNRFFKKIKISEFKNIKMQ